MTKATQVDLLATVNRMEQRLSHSQSTEVRQLWSHYCRVASRFERDLVGSERDIALAKASALMMIQSVEHHGLTGEN